MSKQLFPVSDDPYSSSEVNLSKGETFESSFGICAIIICEGSLADKRADFKDTNEHDFNLKFGSYFEIPRNAKYLECDPGKECHLEATENTRFIVVHAHPQKKGGPQPEGLNIRY